MKFKPGDGFVFKNKLKLDLFVCLTLKNKNKCLALLLPLIMIHKTKVTPNHKLKVRLPFKVKAAVNTCRPG